MWWRGEIMNGWNIRNQWLIRGITIIIVVVVAVVFNGEKIRRVETSQIGFYQHWVIVLVNLTSCAWRRLGYIGHSLEHKMVVGFECILCVFFFFMSSNLLTEKKNPNKKKKNLFSWVQFEIPMFLMILIGAVDVNMQYALLPFTLVYFNCTGASVWVIKSSGARDAVRNCLNRDRRQGGG